MTERSLCTGPYELLLLWETLPAPTVYIPISPQEARDVWQRLTPPRPALVAIDGLDWNRALSPWPAPAAFRRDSAFSGEGSAFLEMLTGAIVPETQSALGIAASYRVIAGYSLAGLFAVWALYQTECFSRAASISGSLWFDGFAEFCAAHAPAGCVEKLYFSLGDREKQAKDPRMARVEACTQQVQALFRAANIPTVWEKNAGGHFSDVAARIARGIDTVCR